MPLTPVLVDAHVHLKEPSGLDCAIAAGISAIRDAGSKENAEQGALRHQGAYKVLMVVSSGWALFKQGGYGSAFGIPLENREQFCAEIIRLKKAGADIIKVMASGMVSLKRPGTITPGGFEREELILLVQAARSQGLPVMAHANGEDAIIAASEAGVRSIEHGFFMTRRALDVMARHGTFWTPTVGAFARAGAGTPVLPETKTYIESVIRGHLEMISEAHERGVPLALGTDCVLPDPCYRAAYEAERNYFEQAGLAREAVQKIASVEGAALLGIKPHS
jgi:predicted amidohydrolase YtcJ